MPELILCQKEEITPVADAIRELCAVDEEMSLVSMRARITNAAAAMQEQKELIGQISEALGVTPSDSTASIEGNTKLLEDLLDTAENSAGLLPELTNEGNAADLLKGKQLIDSDGQIVTGTIESKTAANISLNESTGIVSVPKGYYASAVSHTIPNAEIQFSVIEDSGHAYGLVTPTQKGYLKDTPVPTYIGEYSANVNYTFDDIVLTPHNIPQGYVAAESSVQIAPAVVNEVEEQTDLIDRILSTVIELPPQNPPAIILPDPPPAPEPEPIGELTFVLTTGNSVTMEQLTNIMCSSGVVNQVKLGDEVLWEYDLIKDCEIILAPTEYTFEWIPEDDFGYIGSPCRLSQAVQEGDDLIVVLNGTPYRGVVYTQEFSNDKEALAWRAEGLASGYVWLTDYNYNAESTTTLYFETSLNIGNPITVEIYRTRY